MNFSDFKNQLEFELTDSDYDDLIDAINKNAINGKVSNVGQIEALYSCLLKKNYQNNVELLEKYHNWLISNQK